MCILTEIYRVVQKFLGCETLGYVCVAGRKVENGPVANVANGSRPVGAQAPHLLAPIVFQFIPHHPVQMAYVQPPPQAQHGSQLGDPYRYGSHPQPAGVQYGYGPPHPSQGGPKLQPGQRPLQQQQRQYPSGERLRLRSNPPAPSLKGVRSDLPIPGLLGLPSFVAVLVTVCSVQSIAKVRLDF